METRGNYVMVGAFVLVVVTGLFVAVLWLARVEFTSEFTRYDIYFEGSVTGLNDGAPVRYSGIQIGRVNAIQLDKENPGRVRVTVQLRSGTEIKSDAAASLETQGLTGVAFIEITGGSPTAPPLVAEEGQRYPVIAAQRSRLQTVVADAPLVLQRVIAVADRLNDFLDETNQAAFAKTLKNIERVTGAAAAHSDDITALITDGSAAMRDLRNSLSRFDKAATSVENAGNNATQTLRQFNETIHRLNDVAAHVDALIQENRPGLKDATQTTVNSMNELLAEARVLVGSLTRLSSEIERDPSRFFFGNNREGYRPK